MFKAQLSCLRDIVKRASRRVAVNSSEYDGLIKTAEILEALLANAPERELLPGEAEVDAWVDSLSPYGGADAGVGVKPLEFSYQPTEFGPVFIAKPPLGLRYRVERYNDGLWRFVFNRDLSEGSWTDDVQAIAAAQADYESRILSALSHQPAPVAANASAEDVAAAFINLCEALGLQATPSAYLDADTAKAALSNASAEARLREALEEAGKGARDIRNELDRTRADRDSWKQQFESASAAASEYSEFWEKHSGEFDQFGNYIPHNQIDGDLRAAKDEIERLKALSAHPHASDCDKQGLKSDDAARPLCSCKSSQRGGEHMTWCPSLTPSDRTADVTVESVALVLLDGWKAGKAPIQIARDLLDAFTVGRR